MNQTRTLAIIALLAAIAAGCSYAETTPTTTTEPVETMSLSPTDTAAVVSSPPAVDAEAPLPPTVKAAAPTELGPVFSTGDGPLPGQMTAAIADAGGEALDVNDALARFGIFGIPRPSGANSAVMELRTTGSALPDGGASLTAEVVYIVASTEPIEDLLHQAISRPADEATAETVADYDGTVGDPVCARLQYADGTLGTGSVEGCQYRSDPLDGVRSIGFRRLNLAVSDELELPAVFGEFPVALVAAGRLDGFTATFGRPAGPSGDTVQLEARLQLDSEPVLPPPWQSDGPGRLWNGNATITVDGGRAVWRLSTRADRL